MSLLSLDGINTYYGQIHILQDVALEGGEGEFVCLLGGNASGKSTTLKTILGIVRPRAGRVTLSGEDVTARPTAHRIARGLAIVPENRRLFAPLTVLENLELGAYTQRARRSLAANLARMFAMFPRLDERRRQTAGSLSGGEQQMCAIARALMSEPTLLMVDELSLGLAPVLVDQLMLTIGELHRAGMTILLVEQNLHKALAVAERGVIIETGRLRLAGTSAELAGNPEIRAAYLGM